MLVVSDVDGEYSMRHTELINSTATCLKQASPTCRSCVSLSTDAFMLINSLVHVHVLHVSLKCACNSLEGTCCLCCKLQYEPKLRFFLCNRLLGRGPHLGYLGYLSTLGLALVISDPRL